MTGTILTADPYERVVTNLAADFGSAPGRRAAHAKGVVLTGRFTASPDARRISRAGHLAGPPVDVVARFSSFPGGARRPDTAPEANPRGLAVQFRLPDGSSTDLLAHSIDGFPGRTVEDFAEFLATIGPRGDAGAYPAEHPAAAAFVAAVQAHGTPASFATLPYGAVSAFRFEAADGTSTAVRYTWEPLAGTRLLAAGARPGCERCSRGRPARPAHVPRRPPGHGGAQFGSRAVRVNAVSPTPVATPEHPPLVDFEYATDRPTTPAEVAALIVLLASPRLANLTSADHVIDGGLVKTI